MSDDKLARLAELRASLEYFGAECLKIKDKLGDIRPFVMNKVQLEAHRLLDKQREEKGWVRALILKGRQPGISTYVAARYYHRASLFKGTGVYILSHEQMSSDKLFAIVDRYQRGNPIAPHVGAANAKELLFDKLDSSYAVATAGTKEGGRGGTIKLFHGSEVAYWVNAKTHFAASVQGVPLLPGTEVILESTSAGPGGEFYERWQQAENHQGDYIPIFLPWQLSDGPEYQREPGPGFVLSKESEDGDLSEQEYADIFKVSLRQMAWRRSRILELRDPSAFKREYPAQPADAWTTKDGFEPFINPNLVLRARNRRAEVGGPLIIGVDPASMGGDRFAMAARRGMRVEWVKYRNKIDTLEGTAWVKSVIDELQPSRVNIDAGNIGAAIVTNLKTYGPKYANIVRGVDFGSTSQSKLARPKVPGPKLRRDEMWARILEWLELPEGAQLPDDADLQADLTGPRLKPQLTNDTKLESKSEMKSRQVRSPDLGDAVALTFASKEFFAQYSEPTAVTPYGEIDTLRHGTVSSSHELPPAGPNSWMC